MAFSQKVHVQLIWLLRQTTKLDAMDHMWKEIKKRISTKRRYAAIDEHSEHVQHWT